jgi:transposase
MIYVGIDWADLHHDVCIVDDAGKSLAKFRFENDYDGFIKLTSKIQQLEFNKDEVAVSIETTHGLVVAYLLDLGYTIYPVNPMAAERARDRYKVTGVKDDKLDAWSLANFLRTDMEVLRPLQPSSEHIRKLKMLVMDRKRIVNSHTRALNQLIACLKAYYPVSAHLFNHGSDIFLNFVVQYPTPKKASRITRNRFDKFLKKYEYSAPHKIEELWNRLDKPMIPVEDWIVESKSMLALSLIKQLLLFKKQLKLYDEQINSLMKSHADHKVFKSLPGCGHVLQAQLMAYFGDNREVFPLYRNIQQQSGTAPITKQSGKFRVVRFRRACNHSFRAALHNFTFCSVSRSLWAKKYYDEKRAKGFTHAHALRCLANIWVKIIFKLWKDNTLYDDNIRLAQMMKQDINKSFKAIA